MSWRLCGILGAQVLCLAAMSCSSGVEAARIVDPMELLMENGKLTPWAAWPFDKKTEVKIFQTYGQSEHVSPEQVHMGLDLAVMPGTDVYSPVEGTVCMLFLHGFDSHRRGIGIRTRHRGVEVIVQLLHLRTHSIQFNLGDRVLVGDLVGKVHRWPDASYPTHLHMAMGLGTLTAKGNAYGTTDQPMLGIAPSALFSENTNPLLHLVVPRDEIPPVCVSLNTTVQAVEASFSPGSTTLPKEPFQFRSIEGNEKEPSTWKPSDKLLDPSKLSGLVDIDFAIRDLHTTGVDYALAPLTVSLAIHRDDEDGEVVLQRSLRLDSRVCQTNAYPNQLYLTPPPEMFKEHSAFVFHLTSLNGLGGMAKKAAGWNTQPGNYLITLHAGDQTFKDVLIAKQSVSVVAQ